MGSFRFIFAFSTSLLIQTVTVGAVDALGGGAAGWRNIALIYCILGVITNTIAVFSVKELSEEELNEAEDGDAPKDDKLTLIESAKLLFTNKYYIMICGGYILQQLY